jgi:hypothetical protein
LVGVALGRLWDSHPRLAAALHIGLCLVMIIGAVELWLKHELMLSAVAGTGFSS